ncbi:MAG: ABC transporter permease, partial [Kordiimonadaceae bacterium]|nr:ABC transporter permease [Kordiimonadaceae bacterium]
MHYVLKAISSYLFRHPGQLGLAVLGMAVGIAVIVAVDIANESAKQSFERSINAVTGEASHQILGGPTGLDEQVYIDLRLSGIRTIAPIVEGAVRINGQTFQLLGIDMFAESGFRDYQTGGGGGGGPAGGSGALGLLTETGGVLIMKRAADSLDLSKGDPFKASAFGTEHDGVIVAIMGGEDAISGLDRVLIADIATAQEWLGLVGKLSRIDVRLDGAEQVAAKLPPDARLVNAEGRNNSILEMSTGFNTSLTAMSLFAL